MPKKARARFCWACGKKLWNQTAYVEMEVDGHQRILHKKCAEQITLGNLTGEDEEDDYFAPYD